MAAEDPDPVYCSPRNASRLLGALGRALEGSDGIHMTVKDIEALRDDRIDFLQARYHY